MTIALYGKLSPLNKNKGGEHAPLALIICISVTRLRFRNSGMPRSRQPDLGMNRFAEVISYTSRSGGTQDSSNLKMRWLSRLCSRISQSNIAKCVVRKLALTWEKPIASGLTGFANDNSSLWRCPNPPRNVPLGVPWRNGSMYLRVGSLL